MDQDQQLVEFKGYLHSCPMTSNSLKVVRPDDRTYL